ncbi:hypothetical protein [Longimycelium tulufanense]|nr:hypothetical protein [Longimycelium tulufanense]
MNTAPVEVRRQEDGALLGYVRPAGGHRWQPLTVFGYALGGTDTREAATAVVQRRGLVALTGTWQYRDPNDRCWYDCQLVEASATRIRVCITDPNNPEYGTTVVLDNPGPDTLRPASEW